MKNFKKKVKKFFHKYIVLRLKNKKFVLAWLTVIFAEICAFNKITVTTDMIWMDLFGIAMSIVTNPVQMLTLIGTTIVSFMNPITRGFGDNEFIENPEGKREVRLRFLQEEDPGNVPPHEAPVDRIPLRRYKTSLLFHLREPGRFPGIGQGTRKRVQDQN